MSQQQFRFLDLPCDIRRMVYELVPEIVLRPLLSKEHGIYYQDARAPTALLVANKLIHREIKSWVDTDTRLKMPVTVVICPKGYGGDDGSRDTIELIYNARINDMMYKHPAYSGRPFQKYMARLETAPTTKEEESVREFIRLTVLKLRRGQTVKYRYLVRQSLDDSQLLRDVATTWAHQTKVRFAWRPALTSSFVVVSRNAKAEEPLQLEGYGYSKWDTGIDYTVPEFPACELPLTVPTKEELDLLDERDAGNIDV
jgi:hypothetical protein